jgi:hypothetical protein
LPLQLRAVVDDVAKLLDHALDIKATHVAELVRHAQRLNVTAARARQWATGRYNLDVGVKALRQLQEMSHVHRRMEWELQ